MKRSTGYSNLKSAILQTIQQASSDIHLKPFCGIKYVKQPLEGRLQTIVMDAALLCYKSTLNLKCPWATALHSYPGLNKTAIYGQYLVRLFEDKQASNVDRWSVLTLHRAHKKTISLNGRQHATSTSVMNMELSFSEKSLWVWY